MVCLLSCLRKIKFLISIGFLFFSILVFSQEKKLFGKVKNNTQNAVLGVSLLLKNNQNQILSYAISKNDGSYSITFNSAQKDFYLEVRSLGFQMQKTPIHFAKSTLKKDIVLQEATEKLNEVIIESKRKVVIKKDTITYRIKPFVNETE